MSIDYKNFKVLAIPTFSINTPHDNPDPYRYNGITMQ